MKPADLLGDPYVGYAYSYPHKTAYRPFESPRDLAELWKADLERPLMLYAHVPFCEFRCGFCNLFTERRAPEDRAERYVSQVEVQAQELAPLFADSHFAQLAIGGGTPTALSVDHLERLLAACLRLGLPADAPKAIETSPATATDEHVRLLEDHAFERVSIGVQAFDTGALANIGRPQRSGEVSAALDRLRASTIRRLNIDLIYGAPGQGMAAWLDTVRAALRWRPEELYLYPLYVREKTGIAGKRSLLVDHRLDHYKEARDLLRGEGYVQKSMRMFTRVAKAPTAQGEYRCQDDGMVGLGCGARSYTRECHYSDEWAVSGASVESIVDRWLERTPESFGQAYHGVDLSKDERRRRYLLQGLLQCDGVAAAEYRARFGEEIFEGFPDIQILVDMDLAKSDAERVRLTDAGIARSDAIGPWLYSPAVRQRSAEYEVR